MKRVEEIEVKMTELLHIFQLSAEKEKRAITQTKKDLNIPKAWTLATSMFL